MFLGPAWNLKVMLLRKISLKGAMLVSAVRQIYCGQVDWNSHASGQESLDRRSKANSDELTRLIDWLA